MPYNRPLFVLHLLGYLFISTAYVHTQIIQQEGDITVIVDDFNRDNADKEIENILRFYRNPKKLFKYYGLQPLVITVANGTDDDIVLTEKSLCTLPINGQKVGLVKKSIINRFSVSEDLMFPASLTLIFFVAYTELLTQKSLKMGATICASASIVVEGLLLYMLLLYLYKPILEYQKKLVQDLFLDSNTRFVIKPNTQACIIALVDSNAYWGEYELKLFDGLGNVQVRFNISL